MNLATLLDGLTALRERALPAVEKADDPAELDAVESAYLGRNGELRKLLANIGKLSADDRPKVGAAANPIREELEADSLDLVELIMAFEDKFGAEISDEDAQKITTVGDAVTYIDSHK